MRVHPALLVPDPKRSLNEGAFVKAALSNSKDSWVAGYSTSLARHYGFSLDTPFEKLAKKHVDICVVWYQGRTVRSPVTAGSKVGDQHVGKKIKYNGVVNQLEHHYRWYRKQGTSNSGMDEYLKKVMLNIPVLSARGRV